MVTGGTGYHFYSFVGYFSYDAIKFIWLSDLSIFLNRVKGGGGGAPSGEAPS